MTLAHPAIAGAALLLVAAAGEEIGEPRPSGEGLYAQCTSCHSLGPGDDLPSGPTLHRVIGRRVAARTGFDYSPALRRFAPANPSWTPELLDRFIADPEALVPGTYMAFHGIDDAAKRKALIAWLNER